MNSIYMDEFLMYKLKKKTILHIFKTFQSLWIKKDEEIKDILFL